MRPCEESCGAVFPYAILGSRVAVLRLQNVGKRYHRHGKRDLFAKKAIAALKKSGDDFWALRDVSFTIDRGETVGVLGRNGAGKSTLLGVVVGVTAPTQGTVEREGRISALLELGAGFHPDLTGNENVSLHASLMGLTEQQVEERRESIVRFAEMERFIEEPLRTYSSGMLARLGFSVAVHVEPDILVLDEVMAVGDAAFQDKCREQVAKMSAAGTTLLFVSHSEAFVRGMCRRAIWLEDGTVRADGPAGTVLDQYKRDSNTGEVAQQDADPVSDSGRAPA